MLPKQHAATVTRTDVIRIIQRDFPNEHPESLLALLDAYGQADWQREKDRVQVAILKLCRGDLSKLAAIVTEAQADYREVINPAEYPIQIHAQFYLSSRSPEFVTADLEQYKSWFYSSERFGGPEPDHVRIARESYFLGLPKQQSRMRGRIAPIVGTLLGILLALPNPDFKKQLTERIWCGAVLGFCGGVIMWAYERFAYRPKKVSEQAPPTSE